MLEIVIARMMRALCAALLVLIAALGAGCGNNCDPIALCEAQCVPPGHSDSGCFTDATLGLESDTVSCDWSCPCSPCDDTFDMASPPLLDMSLIDVD